MKKIHSILAAGVIGVVSALVALFGIAKNNNESVLADFSDSNLKFFLSLSDRDSHVYADVSSTNQEGGDSQGGTNGGAGAASAQGTGGQNDSSEGSSGMGMSDGGHGDSGEGDSGEGGDGGAGGGAGDPF